MPRPSRWSLSAVTAVLFALLTAASSFAQSPQQFAPDATRYMALGDSIAAGYKAMPVTDGYAFRLYQDGVFDQIPHTLFNNLAGAGMTSLQVLQFQVPQAIAPNGFHPKYITLTVGGNDLLALLDFALNHTDQETLVEAQKVLGAYAQNLGGILIALRTGLPDAKIFVSNQYTLPEIQAVVPVTDLVIENLNAIIQQVTSQFPNVYLVDVHAAFVGRNNLIEGGRAQVPFDEVHPTNVGHRVIEKAFADVIAVNK